MRGGRKPAGLSMNAILTRVILVPLAIAWAVCNCTTVYAESLHIHTVFDSGRFSVTINGDTTDQKFRVCALMNIGVTMLKAPPRNPVVSLITEDRVGPRFVVFDPQMAFKRSQTIIFVDGKSWTLTGLTDGDLFAVPINFGEEGYYITDALKHGKQLRIDTGTNRRTYTVDLQGFNAAFKALSDCDIYLVDHPNG